MNDYIYKYGKKMRKGFTTGTAACAASKAAVYALVNSKCLDNVLVTLPSGDTIDINIVSTEILNDFAVSSVKVDGGDDRNALDGCIVYCKVSYSDRFKITSGEGVGTVTKKGLKIAVGEPAINPTPLKMIKKAVNEVKEKINVNVEICVKDGESLAKKTLNEKIGIVGGISIIGTTGIVEPMSNKGFIQSMYAEINVMLQSTKNIVIVSGNYGYDYASNTLNIDKRKIVKVSNFVGDALFYLKNTDVKNILMVGHIGKFVKLAGGNFNTHSYVSDSKMEIIVAGIIKKSDDIKAAKKVLECNTTDEACEILKEYSLMHVFDYLCQKSLYKIKQIIKPENINFAIGYFNSAFELVGCSRNFDKQVGVIND